jgi:hypothetical protein
VKYLTTWLVLLSIVIAESHTYIPEKYAILKQNWIHTIDWTMTVRWNVKMLADEINAILYGFAMLCYNRNRINKATVITFIVLCCVDLPMYLHNGNTLYYGSVYAWLLGIWTLAYYLLTKNAKTTWKNTLRSSTNRRTKWQS